MSLFLLTCAAIALLGAAAYYWNTIKEGYFLYFAPWIKEKCGERIGGLFDQIFSTLDDGVRLVRREAKELKKMLQNALCKYDLTYTKKDAETTEITETMIIRQSDGSFVRQNITKLVSNDDLPFSVTEEICTKDSFQVDGKDILEEKIEACLEN